jgi:ribosomal protein S18 acetylase RimI-like enzyme
MKEVSYRPLIVSDVEQVAQIISQAFMNDPLCVYMLPFKKTRFKTLKKFFRAYGEIYIQNQHGYGAGDPLKGVAFWMEPINPDISISVKSLKLFIPLIFTFYPIGYLRARKILKQIDLLHQKYANEPHYYLDNIGVLPSERGKGISSKLIHPFLEKADEERVIVYTDTVTRRNVGLYEHFGFHCVEECTIAGTGITVWAMLRPAG